MDDEAAVDHRQPLALTLRRLRAERKLTQSDLARATGISRAFLSLVEQGRSDITIGRLLRLARFYDLELTDLLGTDADSEADPIRVLRADPDHMIHSDAEGVEVFDLATGSQWTLIPLLTVHQPGGGGRITDIGEHESVLFVLDGIFEIQLADREPVRLRRGEGVIYRSVAPYRVTNVSKRKGRILGIGVRQAPPT
jgi:transcriptional regulator with XRE-family HTH domain